MKPGRISAKTVQNDKAAEVCYTEKGAVFSRAGNENNRNWCSWKICNCEGTEQLQILCSCHISVHHHIVAEASAHDKEVEDLVGAEVFVL